MTFDRIPRSRARRTWRALWPILVVVGGAVTCDNPTAPRPAFISIAPILDLQGISQFAGLTITQARITVIRPPSETLVVKTFPFSVDSTKIDVQIAVDVKGTESLNVVFELLAASSQIVFTGSQPVTVTAGAPPPPAPTPVTPQYVGPGAQIGSLLIVPRDTTVSFGAQFQYQVTAKDSSNNAVATFYSSWSTSSTAHTINAAGLFTAGGAGTTTGPVRVYARTPSGIKDSTTVTIAPPAGSSVISLSLTGNLIGLAGTGTLTVTLSQAAPTGGLTVAVTSDSTQYVTVAAPGTVSFTAGQTAKTMVLNGIATGVSIIHATATGYTAGILPVGVIPPIITLQSGVSVAVGASATMSIQLLPTPGAPVTVTLASTDITKLTVTTTTVNFVAGQANGSASVQGVAAGTAGVTATATGYLQGAALVNVTATGGTAASLTKTAGDNLTAYINDTTAVRPQVRVLDGAGAPVAGVNVVFVVASGGGTVTGASVVSNATGFATLGGTWKMGATAVTNTLTASVPLVPAVTPVTFTATAALPPPVIQLSIFGSTVVGQARTGQLDVTLLQAAPAGGVTVTLVTKRVGLLRIGTYASENGSAVFAQGETLKSVVVFGDSLVTGIDTVIATAPGYAPDTLAVPVSVNLISLPGTLNVPLSTSVSLGITLSTPAPAGGVQVAVVSSDPTKVSVTTPTVTVPQGATAASATLNGAALGTATVTATNPNYAPFQSTVNVTASLNITSTSVSLNSSFGFPVIVQLETGAPPTAVAAPAGGVPVTFLSRNAACAVTTTSPKTIPAGQVSFADTVVYGGTATLPCTTYIVATGPAGFAIDSVFASVLVQPLVSVGVVNIGSGLQVNVGASLGASNHGGTTVHLVSSDPTKALLSLNATTPGTASIDVPIPINQTFFNYYVQGVEGRIADTITVTASAPGFVNGIAAVRVWQPIIDLVGVPTTSTTLDPNRVVYARVWTPSSPTGTQSSNDAIRAGGVALTVKIALGDSTVARLVQQVQGRADTATVTIGVGLFNSPTTVATGGAEWDVVAAGSVITSATSAGTRPVGTALGTTTVVSAPNINLGTVSIGSGLQVNVGASLGSSGHGGTTVHLVSSDPTIALLSLNSTTPGTASIDVPVAINQTFFSYYVQGVEGRIADTITVTASAPSFNNGTGAVRVWQPIVDLVGVPTTSTSLDANRVLYVRVWTPSSPTGTQSSNDAIRAGGVPLVAKIALNDSTVARLVQQTQGRADTATVTIGVGLFNSPTSLATGDAELDVLAAGTVITSATAAGTRPVGSALGVTTTVTAPSISLSTINIGSGLQTNVGASLSTTGHSGVTIHLAVSDPTKALVSPDVSTPGTASIDVVVPAGSSFFTYYVQGVEGRTADTVTLTATTAGFNNGTAQIRVWKPVFIIQSLGTTATSLDPDRVFYVSVWTPSSPIGSISSNTAIRAGGVATDVIFSSLQPTVAQLKANSQVGSPVTATIPVGAFNTPTSTPAGGVSIDYLTTGTTVITADVPAWRALVNDTVTVTVVAPTISVFAPTVASGFQTSGSASLTAALPFADSVTISSSDPTIALVSPNATTAGAASIKVGLGAGGSFVSYYVQAIENRTSPAQVTIRVQVPGFTDGTATASVVQPAVQFANLASTVSVTAVNRAFYAYAGVPDASNSFVSSNQAVRIGGPVLTVNLTSSNPAVARLVTQSVPGGAGAVTVQIQPGAFTSPTVLGTVPPSGVEIDYLTAGFTDILAAITNFISIPAFRVTVQ
jgi:hypothetical protein